MARKRSLVRGGITLAVLAALAGAMVVAPAGAHVTSKFGHLKKHMTQVANKVFNQKITTAKAGDADKLDGTDSAGFLKTADIRVDGAVSDVYIPSFTSATFTPLISKSFTAPSDGFLFIVGSVSWESSDADGCLAYRLRLDSTPVTSDSFAYVGVVDAVDTTPPGHWQDSGSASAVVPVTSGAHTVHLDGQEKCTSSFIIGRDISVIFAKSGSGVTTPVRSPGRTAGSGIPAQG
jgi:hypothetical protein